MTSMVAGIAAAQGRVGDWEGAGSKIGLLLSWKDLSQEAEIQGVREWTLSPELARLWNRPCFSSRIG